MEIQIKPLSGIGIEPSELFPRSGFESIEKTIAEKFGAHRNYNHFVFAWNGSAHRFHGAITVGKQLKQSFSTSQGTTSSEARHQEDQSLFYFFSSALSSIECIYFATAVIVNFLKDTSNFDNEKNIKKITPPTVWKQVKELVSEDIGCRLEFVISLKNNPNGPYSLIYDRRNILSHRGQPGRVISGGMQCDGDTALMRGGSEQDSPITDTLNSQFVDKISRDLSNIHRELFALIEELLNFSAK